MDGASTDNTLAIVETFADDRIRITSEPDTGMYDALNRGLKLYAGDVVGILNADDAYYDATVLGRIASALEEAEIVHGHLNFIDGRQNGRVVRRWRARPRPAKGFASGWMPAHPTFYVRREVAEMVGEFDVSLSIASDYDWMIRALELYGFKSALIDHILVDMTTGGKSTSGFASRVRHNLEALKARRRWLGAGMVDYALVAKPMRKLGQIVGSGSEAMSA